MIEPQFERIVDGDGRKCEVKKCVNFQRYAAYWSEDGYKVRVLICEPHKRQVNNKHWNDVRRLCGGVPPR